MADLEQVIRGGGVCAGRVREGGVVRVWDGAMNGERGGEARRKGCGRCSVKAVERFMTVFCAESRRVWWHLEGEVGGLRWVGTMCPSARSVAERARCG